MNIDKLIGYIHEAFTKQGGCCGPTLAFLVVIAFMLCGCKSVQYVPVIENHTDTVLITKLQHDSIWQHDSVYVHEYAKGDTVFMELTKWHTKYIEKLRTDTMYEHKVDSVPVPYEVPAKLSKWQQLKVDYGGYGLIAAIIFISLYMVRFVRKLMP